jgi:hypothetical protein
MANLSNINNKFLVTTGGNVLIGQTGAIGSSLLQVNGIVGVGSSNQTTLNQTSTHFFMDMTSSTSYFRNTSTAGGGFIFRNSNIGDFEFDNEFAGNIKFNTSNVERMRINSSGNVGIGEGTTNPAARLEVSTEVSNGGGQLIIANRSTDAATTPTKRSEIIYKVTDTVGTVKDAAYVRVTPANQNNTTGSSYAIWTSKGSSNPTESMRIDSSGKVIINDNTIGDKLLLAGDNAGTARGLMFNCSTTTNQGDTWDIDAQSSTGIIKFSTGSSERMRIDSSGSFGLGIVPKASGTAWVNAQFGQATNIVSRKGASANAIYSNNFYIDSASADKRIIAGESNRLFLDGATTRFQYAGTGAANSVVSWSESMRIDSSGNVGIGTTSPETDLMIYDTVNEDPAEPGFATTGMFALNRSGQATLSMGVGANNSFWMSNVNRAFTGPNYYNISLNPLGGRVGVGTTTPSSKLSVFGTQAAIDFQRGTGDSKWEFSSDAARFYIAEMSTGTRDYVMTLEETTGNVGIGTTSPNTGKLVVKGVPYVVTNSGQAIGGIDITSNASGANTYSGAISFGSTASGRAAIAGVQESSDADTQGLAFFTHGSGTGAADADERMRITRGGAIEVRNGSTVGGEIKLSGADNDLTLNGARDQIIFQINGTPEYVMDANQFYPESDNVISLGLSGSRFSTVYAANGVNTSDETLKENIKECDLGIDFIDSLKPKSYNLKDLKEDNDAYGKKRYGLIAQDILETELKDSVFGKKDGEYGLSYNDLIAPMIKAIQELKAEIELLKSK